MSELRTVHIECLNNIPLLLEVIDDSTDVLLKILEGIRDKIRENIENSLTSKKWKIDVWEDASINYKAIELDKCLRVNKGKKEMFDVYCSYSSEQNNVIFFQIMTYETHVPLEGRILDVDKPYRVEVERTTDYYDSISVELQITSELTEKQIKDCAAEFINKILTPYLELLTSTFCN